MGLEAIRLYPSAGGESLFDQAMFVAGAMIEEGNSETAWQVIVENLGKWRPVDFAQVAPVVLLTDARLRTVVTPERGVALIHLPRAQFAEGKPKGKTAGRSS
jgi:hypothetical protein